MRYLGCQHSQVTILCSGYTIPELLPRDRSLQPLWVEATGQGRTP